MDYFAAVKMKKKSGTVLILKYDFTLIAVFHTKELVSGNQRKPPGHFNCLRSPLHIHLLK